MPVSVPTRAPPLLSIHNPLVIPVGDRPTSSGGLFQGWAGVERHGLRVFHPHRWLFASSQEEFLLLRPQWGYAAMADTLLKVRERRRFAGAARPGAASYWYGFPSNPNAPPMKTNGFHLLAVASEGRSLKAYARELADQLQASGPERVSAPATVDYCRALLLGTIRQ